MGYYGHLEQKILARKMRGQGKSYLEIMKKLNLSRSTVSDWCHDVKLTKDQIRTLYESKKRGALKGSIIAAKRKQALRILTTKKLFLQGFKDVGTLTKRDRFIAGIAFYAAEGTKIDKGCTFSNSDPAIIRFMVRWFLEFGHVPIKKFRAALWLHEGLNENKAKRYWSKLTGISLRQFYKTYIAKDKKDSKKVRKNLHAYGVFSFYVNDVSLIRKIMGWIGAVSQKSWYNSPVH